MHCAGGSHPSQTGGGSGPVYCFEDAPQLVSGVSLDVVYTAAWACYPLGCVAPPRDWVRGSPIPVSAAPPLA